MSQSNSSAPSGRPEGEITNYLNRVRAGDAEARKALLEHTYKRFRKLARHMLHGSPALKSELETDDLLNQCIPDLNLALQNQPPESSEHFLNFAAAVMRHKLIDLARRLRRRRPAAARELDQIPGTGAGPENLAQRSEVHRAVEKLRPERLRQVVELLFYQGLKQNEVALELNISTKTVQRDWVIALAKLYECLGGGSQG